MISGIAKRTLPRKIPLIAVVDSSTPSAEEAYTIGVDATFSINRQAMPFEETAFHTCQNYQRTLEDILRLICAAEKMKYN